ncbi:MAG: hypothetical protein BRC31_07745 [Actinobacteria bacterium QS_5_72_10]|nr:MAG: hypothetical protein BRC31_07745 [Actinobacteria bacterium QS_5_72_10]
MSDDPQWAPETVTVSVGRPQGAPPHAGCTLQDYPDLEREDVLAALEFAAAAVQQRELPLTGSR